MNAKSAYGVKLKPFNMGLTYEPSLNNYRDSAAAHSYQDVINNNRFADDTNNRN